MLKTEILNKEIHNFFNWLLSVEKIDEGTLSIKISDGVYTDKIYKKNKGNIMEFISVISEYCDENNISYKTYIIELHNKKHTTYPIIIFSNKLIGKYYYMEAFNSDMVGIYEYKNIGGIFDFVASGLCKKKKHRYDVYKYKNIYSYDNIFTGISRTLISENNIIREEPYKIKSISYHI